MNFGVPQNDRSALVATARFARNYTWHTTYNYLQQKANICHKRQKKKSTILYKRHLTARRSWDSRRRRSPPSPLTHDPAGVHTRHRKKAARTLTLQLRHVTGTTAAWVTAVKPLIPPPPRPARRRLQEDLSWSRASSRKARTADIPQSTRHRGQQTLSPLERRCSAYMSIHLFSRERIFERARSTRKKKSRYVFVAMLQPPISFLLFFVFAAKKKRGCPTSCFG